MRDRDAEFSTRGLSRSELLNRVDQTTATLAQVFKTLTDEVLANQYPEPVAKMRVTTGDFLVHLLSHLAYHLGQIDYHRRMVSGTGALQGAISPSLLMSAVKLD